MKIGYFAPPAPARTGVADYAAALLPYLRRFSPVEPGARHADIRLYHLGNNQLHREIYREALERPGVGVLHDAVLQHFFLGSLDEAAYVEEFVYNYGEWHRGLALEMWRRRAGSGLGARYFACPMLKRVAERSLALVVHNPAAARMVREHAPAARVFEIPHLYEPSPAPGAREIFAFRARLCIAPGDFVFGLFGYLRETKRVIPVLRAFEAVRRTVPGCILLIAGEFVSRDLARAAEPLLRRPGVVRVPYLKAADFRLAIASVDLCLNPRYPAAGETSGITVRAMGAGKPVIVTAGEENARWPEDACLRADPGPAEGAALCDHMILGLRFPGVARAAGRCAAAYIAREHAPERVAERYWKALCECRC